MPDPLPWEVPYATTPRPPSDLYGGPAPFNPVGMPPASGYGSQYDPGFVSHSQWFQTTYGRQPANEAERMAWTDQRQAQDPFGWAQGEEELVRENALTQFQVGAGPEPELRPQSFERSIAAPPPVPTNPQFPSGAPEWMARPVPAERNRINPENLFRAAGQGAFRLGDELAALPAGIRGAFSEEGFGPAFNRALEEEQRRIAEFGTVHPVASGLATLAGGVATGAAMRGLGLTFTGNAAPTASSMIPAATGDAVIAGALTGFGGGETMPERFRNAGAGALTGMVAGPAAGAVGSLLANRSVVRSADTPDELREASRLLFDQARAEGVQFETLSFDGAVARIRTALRDPGFREISAPHAFSALEELATLPAAPGFDDVNAVRNALSLIARTDISGAERTVAGRILENLDDYLRNLSPADVLAGNPAAAAEFATQARTLWRAASNSDTITRAIETARNSAGAGSPTGLQGAIRTQFRTIANNPALIRAFSADEQAIITEIVRGGLTENALRLIGRAAPSNVFSGIFPGLGAAGAAGAALAAGGTSAGIAAPVLGELGARVSGAMTNQNVNYLGAMVRSGGTAAANPLINLGTYAAAAGTPATVMQLPQTESLLDRLLPPPAPRQAQEPRFTPLPWEERYVR